jgi:hypothetical protein
MPNQREEVNGIGVGDRVQLCRNPNAASPRWGEDFLVTAIYPGRHCDDPGCAGGSLLFPLDRTNGSHGSIAISGWTHCSLRFRARERARIQECDHICFPNCVCYGVANAGD